MTTVSLGRSTPNRRRAHAALGTAAAAMVGVATVVVGAQLIGVTPPTSAGLCKHDCIDEAARRHLAVVPEGIPVPAARRGSTRPIRPDPLVSYGPATWTP